MLDSIIDAIKNILPLDNFIDQGYDFVMGLGYLEKLIGGLVGGIIVILGTFELIKKLSKLIIVVAVIVGVWFAFRSGVFDNFIG
ncbi:hypothetical protein CI105_01230 [Candidatus Izimaplasma bacterium ZiA1]|uniref:hypothetical protein n=1 Tax=Candidatus Izimoplasma sp. ZiA1 TaxID=2024899 RepID=UPI000BAA6EC8|nr:hypothetical protein CI105_01230 [Candidatus Izimaplasma bacterium ZiA1]